RLVVHLIGEADARRKSAVKGSLRIAHASASRTPFVTGIYYASGQISSAGVRAKIEESELVTGLKCRRKPVPSKAVVDGQIGCCFPCIANEQGVRSLLSAVFGHVID